MAASLELLQNVFKFQQLSSFFRNSSTNPGNLEKIGPVVSEITCLLRRPVKMENKENIGRTYSPLSMHAKRAK